MAAPGEVQVLFDIIVNIIIIICETMIAQWFLFSSN